MRYYKREHEREEDVDKKSSDDEGGKYVMSFLMSFPHADDTAYLAHCYPYRYSDMMQDVENIMKAEVSLRVDHFTVRFIKNETI